MSLFRTSDDRTTVVFDPNTQNADYHVVGEDTFLTGWGKSRKGRSFAAWACNGDQVHDVEKWVNGRSDMENIRVLSGALKTKPDDHVHVYKVGPKHPSLRCD